MSSNPNKQIDGSVAVVRNVAIGGRATVRGSAVIGHDLKVEGRLEARNIKGSDKGLFKTATNLNEAYPNPQVGWWALVGETLPAQVYLSMGGAWVAQVNEDGSPKLCGTPSIELNECIAELEELRDDVDDAKSTATSAQTTADKALTAADKAQSDVDSIAGKIGVASGIAPLDANGFVPARFIPGAMDDVVEFARIIDSVATILIGRATEAGEVVYCASSGKFLWASASTPTQYYNDWADAMPFGDLTDGGRAPVSGKVYIDISTNKQYRWAGTTMAIVGTDLALGHTAQTAYPGDEGAALAVRVTSLGKELTQMSDALSESIDELDDNISRANSDLLDYKLYLGIFPFDAMVVHAADVMKLAEGSVCFAITEGCFVKKAASGPSYGVPHNILNKVGGFESIRTDVVFRCGAKLYVSPNGSIIEELESSTLRDYITSVRNGARNDLNDLEERMAVLRFDGMVQSVDGIRQEDTDSVWYVVDELCFYQPDEAGLSSSLPHNDSDRLMARDDVIFYCDGVLYRFDGELVEWNAEINARVDEIDAATRLNAANAGISAFDGIVLDANGAMHRPVGAVVYVEKLGYFVERTPSGLSYSVPHNTFDPKYGSVTGVRSDIFFRCGATLYRHDGESLVEWEPQKLRDDVDDLNDALSNAETTLNTKIDNHTTDVSIYPFDGIVATVDETNDKRVDSIWYCSDVHYFVQTTEDGGTFILPHNITPRPGGKRLAKTNALFRKGSTLYRHDGTELIAVTDDIEVVKTALFDDMWASIGGTKLANRNYRMGADGKELTYAEALVRYERNGLIDEWNERCTYRDAYQRTRKIGQYNEYTQLFELNGITDITASEAISILALGYPKDDAETYYYYHRNLSVRTNFPPERTLRGWQSTIGANRYISVANIGENFNGEVVQMQTSGCMAYNCLSLRKVIGILDVQTTYYQYGNCPALQEAKIITTKRGNTLDVAGCPLLNLESVSYTIANSVECTVKCHPDVYAKLIGDTTNEAAAALTAEELAQWTALGDAAAEKNIAIATV
ncbi:MAG: hypothetical protein K2L55_01715 [Muribaculaceae bacterium]|nr:hypothetical protein [Muribaculaceae bacterium]